LETEGGSQKKRDAIVCNIEEMQRGGLCNVVEGAAEMLDGLKEP
jgi:hypothetical protein